jgi:hypothetical protein
MKCDKCNIELKKGIAIENTVIGRRDEYGGAICTMSYGGPGKLITCLKCPKCGKSFYERKVK